MTGAAEQAVSDAFQAEWGKVVAALIGMTGDWDLAEECAQDAFAQALRSWPADGVPRRPGAWLTTVARNRALDRLRRRAAEAVKLREAAILGLYDQLGKLGRSPVVELNRAVAVGLADGPEAGLRLLAELTASGQLSGYHLLPAARADLLRRLGRSAEASASYRQALGLVVNDAERRFLERRLAEAEAAP
ncbi:MAG TPA: sigma factor [Streptosporangiaceae bacterium]|nr:sigma factor [Streptosporangiaceae bacterium]